MRSAISITSSEDIEDYHYDDMNRLDLLTTTNGG